MTAPSPQVYVQGLSAVTADNLNTFVQTVTTASQLRLLVGVANMVIYLQGISSPGDGDQGEFYWSVGTGYVDNNYTTIVPTGVTSGAWVRLSYAAPAAGFTVAGLPSSPATGSLAYVTDGTASLSWGATVTGGSSTKYLVWYNGSNWTVAGK